MRFKVGDRVRAGKAGTVSEVVYASPNLDGCSPVDGGYVIRHVETGKEFTIVSSVYAYSLVLNQFVVGKKYQYISANPQIWSAVGIHECLYADDTIALLKGTLPDHHLTVNHSALGTSWKEFNA